MKISIILTKMPKVDAEGVHNADQIEIFRIDRHIIYNSGIDRRSEILNNL